MRLSAFPYYLKSIYTLFKDVKPLKILFQLTFSKSCSVPKQIHLQTGEAFIVNSLMDIWILKETILDKQYQYASETLLEDWTVLDIGAALGDFTVWSAKQLHKGKVIAVEPFPPSVDLLIKNLQLNDVKNVEVYKGAIAGFSGLVSLDLSKAEAVKIFTTQSDSPAQFKVNAITLTELFSKYQINKCDYLKMDCEGAEYEILFSTDENTFSKIDRICMEVHNIDSNHNSNVMAAYLQKNGFLVRITKNPVHQSICYLYAVKAK